MQNTTRATEIKNSLNHLPYHVEAERSVLGAILLKDSALSEFIDQGLDSSDFYSDIHQKIYSAMLALSEKDRPIDLVTLSAQLRDQGWFEQIGGSQTLTTLFDECFLTQNSAHYGSLVKEKAVLRRVIEVTSEIRMQAFQPEESLETLIDDLERKVLSISNYRRGKTASNLREIFMQNMQTVENIALRKSELIGLPSGFRDLDRITGGLKPGQLMILAARPSMGKTSMMLSMIQNVVKHDKNSVIALFSLEMDKEELGFRLLSSSTQISSSRIKFGKMNQNEWSKLTIAPQELAQSKVQIDDQSDLTVMEIKARCRRILASEKRIDLIVIDYLQLLHGSKTRGEINREREVSEISRALKGLAKELKVPVIALSQLNRSLESRQNKRPLLSDLRESGSIEADADLVTFIYRDEVYDPESKDAGIAELIIAKHRAGPTGTVKLGWVPDLTTFRNL